MGIFGWGTGVTTKSQVQPIGAKGAPSNLKATVLKPETIGCFQVRRVASFFFFDVYVYIWSPPPPHDPHLWFCRISVFSSEKCSKNCTMIQKAIFYYPIQKQSCVYVHFASETWLHKIFTGQPLRILRLFRVLRVSKNSDDLRKAPGLPQTISNFKSP